MKQIRALALLQEVVREVEKAAPTQELAERFIEVAANALAHAETFADVKAIHDKVAALEGLFRRQKAELVSTNLLAAQRLQTERMIGAYLSEVDRQKKGRPDKKSHDATFTPKRTLKDFGVSRDQSSRWQRVAEIKDDDFQEYVGKGLRGEVELTTAGALEVYDETILPVKKQERKNALPKFPAGGMESLAKVTIINGDARQLSDIVDKAHLIFTSPPYNVGMKYGTHNDTMAPDEYKKFMKRVYGECYKVLVEGGRIGVNVPFGVDRNPYVPIMPLHLAWLADAGFTVRGIIVWDKGTTGNRTSWGSWASPSNPALRDRTECIIVCHKGKPDLPIKGPSLLEDGDRFMELTQDVWQVAPENAQRKNHPAPFPVSLPERFLQLYGYRGCKLVDPFMGTGGGMVAAWRNGCEGVGVDIDPDYCAEAKLRLAEEFGT
jgi:site-specific DNA-methyltransferase (adenine-specific)